jgi:uncharacterized membrane protein
MFVAFLPFATGVLGQYGNIASSTILFALALAIISATFILVIDHLDRHRIFMTRRGEGFDFARAKVRHLVTGSIFLLSILAALYLPGYAQIWWLLLGFNHEITERIMPYLPERFRNYGQS